MYEKNHSSTVAGPEKIINKTCFFFLGREGGGDIGARLVCFMVCVYGGGGGFQTCRHPYTRVPLSPVLGLQRPSHKVSQEVQNDQIPRPLGEGRKISEQYTQYI